MRKDKRKKRRWLPALAMALAPMLLSGCGKQFETTRAAGAERAEAEKEDLIVVGVSQLGSESVWRTAHTASIQRVFTRDNGYMLIFENARQKQENQLKAIRSFISQRVDYIVFSPIEEEGFEVVLKEAKEAGIPVILMDREVQVEDESLYTAWVGSDFLQEGRNAGLWLEDYLEEQGRSDEKIDIAVFLGTPGGSSTEGRSEGFEEIVDQHQSWAIVEEVEAEFTTTKAREEMEKILKRRDDLDVIVSQNDDMTFGILEVLEEEGISTGVNGDVIVISFDAVHAALEKVQEGVINVDIECNPEQGEYVEQVIQSLEAGEPVEKRYYVSEEVFTQENVGEFLDSRSY